VPGVYQTRKKKKTRVFAWGRQSGKQTGKQTANLATKTNQRKDSEKPAFSLLVLGLQQFKVALFKFNSNKTIKVWQKSKRTVNREGWSWQTNAFVSLFAWLANAWFAAKVCDAEANESNNMGGLRLVLDPFNFRHTLKNNCIFQKRMASPLLARESPPHGQRREV